jgi:hypothetical protein
VRCPEVRAFLHPFLDGELDVEKNVIVLQHLELCGCCRDRFEDEKRLLVRFRDAIHERCPEGVRIRILDACSHVPCGADPLPILRGVDAPIPIALASAASVRRRRAFPWRLTASAAAVAIVFLGIDPLCLFGCSTVRALAREHRIHNADTLPVSAASPAELGAQLGKLTQIAVEVPRPCPNCCHFSCEGGTPLALGEGACLLRFRDGKRTFSFIQARGAQIHPMLRGRDGLYFARDGECCLVGWRETSSDELCAVIADEASFPMEGLVALAAALRAEERANH